MTPSRGRHKKKVSHLVSSADVLLFSVDVDALGNVRTLLLQSHQHVACLIVKPYKEKLVLSQASLQCTPLLSH